jgi:beta-lactamase regulating signal transducer with metallopeptidase domain
MTAENILGTAFAALLNSLWQSAAIALLVWTALRFLPRIHVRINAATRCAVWWAVLAAVVLLPMAQPSGTLSAIVVVAPQVASSEAVPVPVPAILVSPTQIEAPARPSHIARPLQITAGAGLFAIFALWSVLSLFRVTQIIRSYRYLRGIKQRSRAVSPEQLVNFNYWLLACGVDRTARLLVSSEIVSPMAVGFRRPAVIVPETLLNEFTAEEMDHVILHELAHIARYDDWTNLFARLIGALLPVHPVAVWLVKRIEQEREIACDDWVVAMTGEARPYAASLTRLFELCSARRRQLLATGMADRASHLGERIEALLRSGRDFAPRVSILRVALGAAILLGLVLLGARAPHWIVFAQEPAFAQEPTAIPSLPPVSILAQAAPVAPVAPRQPVPVVAPAPPNPPYPPQAPEENIALPRDMEIRQFEIQRMAQQVQQMRQQLQDKSRIYNGNHPDMVQLNDDIRRAENEMRASVEQLRAQQVNHNQSGSFLAALVAAGYGNLSVDEIIELRNAGVSAEFLHSVADSGAGKPSAKDLIALAHSGVSPEFLRGLRNAGFKEVSVQDTIELATSGVSPELIRALRGAFPQITTREMIDAAHAGVGADSVRQAREYGSNLTLEQIIKLKKAGVI